MNDLTFIETQFPIARLSAESYKERKAVSGQTLTGLGKWWGRKPLVLVRASILAMLMPASSDRKKDREIFLKLLTMDAEGLWRRRKGTIPERDLVARAPAFEAAWRSAGRDDKDELREEIWESLADDVRAEMESLRRFPLSRAEFDALSYEDKLKLCVRPEHLDGPDGETWQAINAHLGTSASSIPELVEQLGARRFGHRPIVGDSFCGGGSIPFEAARIGCEAFGSDLNPVAGLLTWANLNLLGAGRAVQEEVKQAQAAAFTLANKQVLEWGIETNAKGERAESFIYCVEVKPPGCEYFIPLAPSWMVDEYSRTIVRWRRVSGSDRLMPDVVVVPKGELDEFKRTKGATVADGRVLDPFDASRSWSIEALRGPTGLRRWSNDDVVPRPDDVFQERLYCIRWIDSEGTRRYAAPDDADLERETKVLALLRERFSKWQRDGVLPSRKIPEDGDKTEEPIRTRGWTYWHHLFTPRQLLVHGLLASLSFDAPSVQVRVATMLNMGRLADWDSRLCCWLSSPTQIAGGKNTFLNQALNPLFNYSTRPFLMLASAQITLSKQVGAGGGGQVAIADARDLAHKCDIWITDPPYADAVNYHELGDFFLAWYDKQLKKTFPDWIPDARAELAVRGNGDDFRRSMVDIYKNLTQHMPDNGMQMVMFTHQDPAVWADLGMILWAAGLRVTSAWTVATETPAGGIKKGNYVQGTVLLVLRKRLNPEDGFLDEVYPLVEDEVRRQIDSMRALDEGGEPNFGDTDYQLAAYAAALRVLTQYQTLDGQDVGHELFRARPTAGGRGRRGVVAEKSRFEQVIERGIRIACDYLVPRGLETVWQGLTADERLYLRALDVESRGERRQGVYQELARGFGVREVKPLLHADKANSTRVRTPGEFGRKDLDGDGFGGTKVRQLLFAVHTTVLEEKPEAGMRFLKDELRDYWSDRQRLITILDWFANLGQVEAMSHWVADSQAARLLAGRLRSDHG